MTVRCQAPFHSINLMPDGYQSCCMHTMPRHNMSLNEFWNSEEHQNLQQQFIDDNITNDICKKCLVTNSLPQQYNTEETTFEKGEINPVFLNMVLSNKCNLSCRTCNSYLSSTVQSTAKKVGITTESKIELVSMYTSTHEEELVLQYSDSVKTISLTGGEVFNNDRFLSFIKKIHNSFNNLKTLNITTNGHYYNELYLNELKKIAEKGIVVNISFSIDGDSETSEYIRIFSNLKLTYKNLFKVLNNYPMFVVSTHTTISIYNIWHLDRYVNDLLKVYRTNKDFSKVRAGANLVIFPEHQSINNIIDKSSLITKLEKDELLCDKINIKSHNNIQGINTIKYIIKEAKKYILTNPSSKFNATDDNKLDMFSKLKITDIIPITELST